MKEGPIFGGGGGGVEIVKEVLNVLSHEINVFMTLALAEMLCMQWCVSMLLDIHVSVVSS